MRIGIKTISQYLLIVFNDAMHTAMTGTLSSLSITADTSGASTFELQLAAEVDRQPEPHQLSGSLQAVGCNNPFS